MPSHLHGWYSSNNEWVKVAADQAGNLVTAAGSVVTSELGVNSTTTPLASGATFTGTGEQNDHPDVMVSCQTDNSGTLFFDFSVNGSDWGTFPVAGFAVASGIHEFHIAVKGPRHFRVRLVNDTGAQTYLRLYTYYGDFKKPNAPLSQALANDSDALTVKAVLSGQDPDGTFVNVGVNEAGSIDTTSFFFESVRGNMPGFSTGTKFGRNPDIDTGSAPEDIWNSGGVYTGHPVHSAAAETVELFSSSANDTSAGTGARTVRIFGLNGSWVEITEDVTLNGTSAVTTANSYKRLNRMYVLTAGTGAENAGTITARHTTTTANVFAVMPAGQNQTTIAAFTVPDAKTLYILRVKAQIGRTSGAAGSADYSIRIREEGGVYRAIRYETITTSFPDAYTLQTGLSVPARADILFRCESVSDNNTAFSAAFEYILVDN